MQKRWKIVEITDSPAFEVFKTDYDALCVQQGKNPLPVSILKILFQRGIDTLPKAETFFKPQIDHLHPPFLMKDMDKAVQRIEIALQNNENVLIYGDYDVDGTTAVALVYSFLKKLHPRIDFYIPDRYKEDYGISTEGIDYAQNKCFSLIIALDCGIKSIDKIQYAKSLGIDFIICDHHLPAQQVPQAVAVLDPKQTDCPYPYKELSGCGIGFKLMQALSIQKNIPFQVLYQYIELVAISIAADIVPITGENRTLAYFGLQKLNSTPMIGLKTMMQGLKKSLYTISDVVFLLAPRINAAGRIGDAKESVKMMIADDATLANNHSTLLELNNNERKEYDSSITREALEIIDNQAGYSQKHTTVVYQPSWHKGVIGIVASRLIEKHYRPTVVLTQSNGLLSGSARSVHGFDLYAALSQCEHLLEQFGGHPFAAGLSLKEENLEAFQCLFDQVVADNILQDSLCPEIVIDGIVQIEDITPKFYHWIQRCAPFGPQNMNPIFMTSGLYFQQPVATVVGNDHLKLRWVSPQGEALQAIGFGLGHAEAINNQQKIDICYHIENNIWREIETISLNIKDLRLC